MSDQVVLILDDDNDFVEMLRGAIEVYGIDVQRLKNIDDGILKAKVRKPKVIFIAVENDDKKGFSLCTKIKKAVGSTVPVVLTTSTLSEDDCKLHEKQRFSADSHMIKHGIQRHNILYQIEKVIDLGVKYNQQGRKMNSQIKDKQHSAPSKNKDGKSKKDEPTWLKDFLNKTDIKKSGKKSNQSDLIKNAVNDMFEDVSGDSNELEEQIAEQETEIAHLRRKLDEARREARSSPFSSDYVNLQEEIFNKDTELNQLNKKQYENDRKLKQSEERLKEIATRLVDMKNEMDESLARNEELTKQLDKQQNEFSDMQKEIAKNAEAEARKQLETDFDEYKIEQKLKIKKIEDSHLTEIVELKRKFQEAGDNEIKSVENRLRQKNEEQKNEHNETIAKLEKRQQAEIDELKSTIENQKSTGDSQLKDAVAQAEKSAEKTINDLTARYEKQVTELNELVESLKGKKWEETVGSIEEEHTRKIEELNTKHENEIAEFHSLIEVLKITANDERKEAIAAVEKDNNKKLDELKGKYETDIEDLNSALNSLKAGSNVDGQTSTDQVEGHEKALNHLKNKYDSEISKLNTTIKELKSENEENNDTLELVKLEHDEELSKLLLEIEDIRKTSKEEIKEAINIAEGNYLAELNDIKARHKNEIVKIKVNKESNKQTEQKLSKEIEKLDKEYKKGLHALDTKYTTEIKQAKDERDREIIRLKKDVKESTEALNKEKKAHTETRARFEALNLKHASEIDELKGSKNGDTPDDTIEDLELKLKQANQKLEKEKKDHEETRVRLESKLVSKIIAQSKQ